MKHSKLYVIILLIIFIIFSLPLLADDNWPTSISKIWYKSIENPLESIFDETFLRMAYYYSLFAWRKV